MNQPGASTNWNGRAVTWTHTRTDNWAEKIEYFCSPIGRAFGQDKRAEKLTSTLGYYKGWDIVLVGHSNGAAVILEALRIAGYPRIEAIHLVSGACEADFWQNGLNAALIANEIGKVFVYVGGKDMAMRYARTWLARWLGYGTLGLHGAINIADVCKDSVGTLTWPDFGHSDCFHDDHFDSTMKHFFL